MERFISHYFAIIIIVIAIFARVSSYIFNCIIEKNHYKKILRYNDSLNRRNMQFMDEVNSQLQDEMNRQFMDELSQESMKSTAPFELGGHYSGTNDL